MSPRKEEQNKQIREERREQLLRTALKVFAKKGLSATKINDIATEAGSSYGLVYHYLGTKEEIFTKLVEMALEGSVKVVEMAARQDVSPYEQLKWLTETILKGLADHGAYYYLIIIQAFTSEAVPVEVKRMVSCTSPTAMESLIPIIKAGQQAGQIIQENPVMLAVAYFAMIQGIAMHQVQNRTIQPILHTDLLLRMFRA
ncbi:TetR/AcrR family transcriptional regulator [Cohnella luojiensis]|uniref:TetR/AcrR family transcriptional regulator n=1 Tax=Cohnella luojiensis TaxID=652876 RepID=A0A4Y8M8H1_9BACL|nr:TetR/AcrR family transcriptional regulator [Cohnella luojiensis]TFE31854.1 TetR/AcrR family transcriptional regulator [Cohnella luojiensis]